MSTTISALLAFFSCRPFFKDHSQSKCRVVKSSLNGHIYKNNSNTYGTLWKRGTGRLEEPKNQGVCFDILSVNVRSYTCTVSPAWLPKHEWKKDYNRLANVDGRKHTISRSQNLLKYYLDWHHEYKFFIAIVYWDNSIHSIILV